MTYLMATPYGSRSAGREKLPLYSRIRKFKMRNMRTFPNIVIIHLFIACTVLFSHRSLSLNASHLAANPAPETEKSEENRSHRWLEEDSKESLE